MKEFYNLPLFLFSILLGGILGSLGSMVYEKLTFKAYDWREPPIIVNCYGEDFNELYLVHGVSYWTALGYKFTYIEQNPTPHMCKANYIQGFILIKKSELPEETLAVTHRKIFLGKITAAVIYFKPGTFKLTNVVEHELGHALGFGHVEIDGHLMNPEFEKMSPKFWIPE